MKIEKAQFEKYFLLFDEAESLKENTIMPRIREIAERLHGFSPEDAQLASPSRILIFNHRADDMAYVIPVDLLFDPEMEASVDRLIEARNRKWEAEAKRAEAMTKARVEATERAELERLLAKYPDARKAVHPHPDPRCTHGPESRCSYCA